MQREEVCNHKLSKAERALAVCSSGRKNKKGDFCFCQYTGSVYYRNMKSQKSFSQLCLGSTSAFKQTAPGCVLSPNQASEH